MDKNPAPELCPLKNLPAASISNFEGAKDFMINDSVINNIAAGNLNQTIIKIDGSVPLTEKLRSLFVSHIAGTSPAPEFVDRVGQYILAQSIRDLPRAKAAYDDYDKNERASCFEGTRKALLADIGEWILSPTELLVYVLSGLAGIGKSTVAQTIAERAANLGILGASFFFSRNESDRRTAEKFVTTIAFQLCVYNQEFAEAIGKALTKERGSAVITKDPEKQLAVLILEPLGDLAKARSQPVVIVVDALDECNDKEVPSVLRVLSLLVQTLPSFKVILTTRPQSHIQFCLEFQKVFYLQDIDDKVVDSDIHLYLKHCLSCEQVAVHLPKLWKSWNASDEEIEALVRGAGTLFIIASTSVLFILDTKVRNPALQMRRLQSAFGENRTPLNALNGFYTVILRSALPEDSDPETVERFQTVLGTIILAQDPVPIEPFSDLVGLDLEDVYAVLDNLQPVISLKRGYGEKPHIHHKSFPDFITDPTRCKDRDLCVVLKDHHTRIASRCFHVMNARLKHNIAVLDLGTPEPFMPNDEGLAANGITEAQLGERIPLQLRYACIYWANHLRSADIQDTDLTKGLELFGAEHLLHWVEALSWIGKLDLASRAVDILLKLLKPTSSGIFYDARRFISRSYTVIQHSPLHTYYSALAFAPSKSLLYNKYHKDRIHNLCDLDCVPEQWNATISDLPVHVYQVAFSADSSQLAFWTDDELNLLDARSGTPLKTFKGDRFALSEDFSVVAISEDRTVALRCVATDVPIRTLTHTTKVKWLNLSLDGTRIAATLSDDTVCLWDRSRGKMTGKPAGHDRGQLEFLPSDRLAYVSTEGDIKLWDEAAGGIFAELDCRSSFFTISHDASRLASLDGANLGLWNTENGELIGVAEDDGNKITISDDGSFIATWIYMGREVRLWSGNSLSLIATLRVDEPGDWISALALSSDLLAIGCQSSSRLYDLKTFAFIASTPSFNSHPSSFSPDCTRLAVGSQHSLQLLHVPSLKVSRSYSLNEEVTALAFSPDCSLLASGSRGGAITLWDTCRPCKPIASQQGHSRRITTLAFSLDGGRLASKSWDSVRVWDGRDGGPVGTLEHPFHPGLRSVALSSSLLAAATDDDITLFNLETLCLVHTINQRSSSNQGDIFLSFSSNGSFLATAYNNIPSHTSDVTVLTVEGHKIATFHLDSYTYGVILSPDGSQLSATDRRGGLKFFDVDKKYPIQQTGREVLNWMPHLNGTLISFMIGGYDAIVVLSGRFIDYSDPFPLLWIPGDIGAVRFAAGSSVFALGTKDGRIIIGRAPTSSLL